MSLTDRTVSVPDSCRSIDCCDAAVSTSREVPDVPDTCLSIDCCDTVNYVPQTVYRNTKQTYTADCTEGHGSYTAVIAANTYISFESQAAADALALAAATSKAEELLGCSDLSGMMWTLPRTTLTSDVNYCDCDSGSTQTASLSGSSGVLYDIRIRFRGVVEQKTYTGGTADGYFYTGGSPASDGYNVYQLHVDSPEQDYYMNSGTSGGNRCYGVDYYATIQAYAGATFTLSCSSIDASEVTNHSVYNDSSSQISVSDDDPDFPILVSQPYDTQSDGKPGGQFLQLDVYSIVPA